MQVRCNGISHHYKAGVRALSDITMDLGAGVTGLVGVNGAGKSTLLSVLSGGLRPTRGTVSVQDDNLYGKGRRAALARTALMPQDFRVPGEMRTLEVVTYLGWLRGLSSRELTARSLEVLEVVGLADRRSTLVSALSGGMVRRLALAQALIAQPSLLLLDEPTTGLDPEQRAAVRRLIAEQPGDRTTIVSSHVMEDVESLANDVLVLDHGCVLFHGSFADFVGTHDPHGSAEHAFLAMLTRRNR